MARSTTNYKRFKLLTEKGNREVKTNHVKRLVEAISKKNMLEQNPIIVNKYDEVIDGQHRLKAAEELGVPIYYIFSEDSGIDEVMILNDNVRQWRSKDFINAYARKGIEDYAILLEAINLYKLPITVIAGVLMFGEKVSMTGGGEVSKQIKAGTFKVNHLRLATLVLEDISEAREMLKNKSYTRSRNFIVAFLRARSLEGIDMERFYHALKAHARMIGRKESINDYLRAFEKVYNYKTKNVEELRFF